MLYRIHRLAERYRYLDIVLEVVQVLEEIGSVVFEETFQLFNYTINEVLEYIGSTMKCNVDEITPFLYDYLKEKLLILDEKKKPVFELSELQLLPSGASNELTLVGLRLATLHALSRDSLLKNLRFIVIH